MRKWRIYFTIILQLCIVPLLHAQWEIPIGQYWDIKSYYNPSFAGETNYIRTTMLYSNKWTGIENAPVRIILTADMPIEILNQRHGIGVLVLTENIGELRNPNLAAQYSFIQPIGNGTLNIGLQAGVYDLNYDAGALILTTDSLQKNNKKIMANPTKKQLADFSAGLSWSSKNFYSGLSIMHINQPHFYSIPRLEEIKNETAIPNENSVLEDSFKTNIPRTYFLTAQYNISLFNSLKIEPMISVMSNKIQTYFQATLRLEHGNKYSGGFSYISDYGYTFFAGATIRGAQLGYSYTRHNIGIGKESSGSHEILLKYDFPLDYFKPKSQPHKSIRLL